MIMTKKRVSELEGAQLDWAVVVAAGKTPRMYGAGVQVHNPNHDPDMGEPWVNVRPSTDWGWGGPIIERERIALRFGVFSGLWSAWPIDGCDDGIGGEDGPTPLIAAMRAFVASKLGDEVEVPECS